MNPVDSDPGTNLPQASLQGWSPMLCRRRHPVAHQGLLHSVRIPMSPGTAEAHGPAFEVALPSKASLDHLLAWAFGQPS